MVSFGAPKPATHRRPKPATMWGVLDERILLFEPVGKGWGSVRDDLIGRSGRGGGCFRPSIPGRRAGRFCPGGWFYGGL